MSIRFVSIISAPAIQITHHLSVTVLFRRTPITPHIQQTSTTVAIDRRNCPFLRERLPALLSCQLSELLALIVVVCGSPQPTMVSVNSLHIFPTIASCLWSFWDEWWIVDVIGEWKRAFGWLRNAASTQLYGYLSRHSSPDGGFGTVIEVKENSTGEHFAVKMMRCISKKDNERIGREVNRLRLFVHPGIVKLKEVVPMENMQAIVMELGGQSLAQLVSSHNERGVLVDRHIVYQVMVDISSALCFMHNHSRERTAHGDVKLENILLFGNGHAKLCDLRAAESEDVSTTRGVISMQYVSPERMEDPTGRASGSADVWALGIVLHWLLFGKGPFSGQTMIKLAREIESFEPSQIGTSCGEKERELLKRMLDPDCGSRLTSTQLVDSKILRCLINTTAAGWKLDEMRSREADTKLAGPTKATELQKQLKKEQAARLKEREVFEKERSEMQRKMEEMAAMLQARQRTATDGTDWGRTGREPPMDGQQRTRSGEGAVRRRDGAAAIEFYKSGEWSVSGSVFRSEDLFETTLLSFSFGKVVARFTFTIKWIETRTYIGLVTSSQTENAKERSNFVTLSGGAGWDVNKYVRTAIQNSKEYLGGSACAAGKKGQRVVLEADGRDGKRTLKLSQDGETQSVFFTNIPVPFRFAIRLCGEGDSVSIESTEELREPTLRGGTAVIKMD
ncbi:putative serine/threonine protein kinase [Blattamonas nauphoetae]|uniref:Serine/threonine protein kinase n=1 Tax=Blattamonas nauphoetae TaxID=2049346 RepID=A0ABQ9XUQ2_9EUKA|nr:putative serine/threonine protein kinase [Blattamonas nauphoetae]